MAIPIIYKELLDNCSTLAFIMEKYLNLSASAGLCKGCNILLVLFEYLKEKIMITIRIIRKVETNKEKYHKANYFWGTASHWCGWCGHGLIL